MRVAAGTTVQYAMSDGLQANKYTVDWMYTIHHETIQTSEWVTYVIDLNGYNHCGAYVNGNASATVGMYGFRTTNATIDLAYFAVCDSWEEVDSIVTEETVVLTQWLSGTADDSVVDLTGAAVEQAQ